MCCRFLFYLRWSKHIVLLWPRFVHYLLLYWPLKYASFCFQLNVSRQPYMMRFFHNNLLRAAEFFCAQKEHMDTSQLSGKIRKKQIETVDHLHNFHHVSRGNIQFYRTHRNKDIASSQHTSFAAASTGSSLRFWGCGEFIIKSPWVDGWVVNHSHPRLW